MDLDKSGVPVTGMGQLIGILPPGQVVRVHTHTHTLPLPRHSASRSYFLVLSGGRSMDDLDLKGDIVHTIFDLILYLLLHTHETGYLSTTSGPD